MQNSRQTVINLFNYKHIEHLIITCIQNVYYSWDILGYFTHLKLRHDNQNVSDTSKVIILLDFS